jgi:AcrR family transcriptional regulator
MDGAPPPRTRAERARRTRAQIIEAAIRLFAERSFDGTSLQMIADELGLTKAAVYYHFHAKVDILRALLAPVHQEFEELLTAVEARPSRRARIETLADGLADILVAQRALGAIAANDPALRGRLNAETAQFEALRERSVRALYGPNPTTDERAAAYLGGGLADVMSFLGDLDDDTLRTTLRRTYIRVLTIRS